MANSKSQTNGAVVTVQAATTLPEFPSIGFTLPRDLVFKIDTAAKNGDISRSEFLRQLIANEFKYTLPDAKPRGRVSSLAHLTDEERKAEMARRAILIGIRGRAERLAMKNEVMARAKAGQESLTCEELEGAIMRHESTLIAEYEKKHSVSLAEPTV